MTRLDLEAARVFAADATALRRTGAPENALRHVLSTNLTKMFPDSPWWIREHSANAEANVHYIDAAGAQRRGFIDSLVGMTAIEYEKDLTVESIYKEGHRQLAEYCSGLLNRGISPENIIGVLSDTVDWFAFSVQLKSKAVEGRDFGPDDIVLEKLSHVSLVDVSDSNLWRFNRFINRYLGRKGSRVLNPQVLASDLGFGSEFWRQNISGLRSVVEQAFSERPQYARIITSLRKNFIGYLEGGGGHFFEKTTYANEVYVATLAKLLSANILSGSVVRDQGDNVRHIIDGQWFKTQGFVNLVEYDYFGWLHEAPYIDHIIPIAQRMQKDLAAYDYSDIATEDLFGPLLAQLALSDRRLLLGQEFTPQWLAEKLVERAMETLPEGEFPTFLDMCCGSGVFIVETIKQTISRYNVVPERMSGDVLRQLTSCIVGFDIDPVAVLLSKLNWALAMRAFRAYAPSFTIPVYHADSLFTVAPTTSTIDADYERTGLSMRFDDDDIQFPGFLLTKPNRRLFDSYVHASYQVAKARALQSPNYFSHLEAKRFVKGLTEETGIFLDEEQQERLIETTHLLIPLLEDLQRNGRNGIWPFLLVNGYRPGLVKGQFNGIVTNPPWLAMSRLADNPYTRVLTGRAERYGIKPRGSSHLHIELATVFLLNSVDKYLQPNAWCGFVMPDTILNGYHHEPFRNQTYRDSDWRVDFVVREIWDVPGDTFKNKAIVIFGKKADALNPNPLTGRKVYRDGPDEPCEFRLLRQGRRSAWSSNPDVKELKGVLRAIPMAQGADVMPRSLIFHHMAQAPNGRWNLSPIPRHNHGLSYLVKGAKRHEEFSLDVHNVDDEFVYDVYLSHHVLPFVTGDPAKALLPIRVEDDEWRPVEEPELVSYGVGSQSAFHLVFAAAGMSAREFFGKINYRNKLTVQRFYSAEDSKLLVMVGAGGGYTCAAYVGLENIRKQKVVVDQTLYWYLADSEDEALYIVGMLNSRSLDATISDFQPVGVMGRRHIHTLPYAITPPFDPDDPAHRKVATITRALRNSFLTALFASPARRYLDPANSSLQVRRRKLRELIRDLPESREYEDACAAVYGV